MKYVCKARPTFIFSYELGLTVDNTTVNVEFKIAIKQTLTYCPTAIHLSVPIYGVWCTPCTRTQKVRLRTMVHSLHLLSVGTSVIENCDFLT